MIAGRTITRTITVRQGRERGKLKRVIDLLEWRNWQTHGTQNPATFTGHEGSTPSSSTSRERHEPQYGDSRRHPNRLSAGGRDLSRRALEALAADEYKHERITKPEPQRLLGIETSFQLDEFLKAHDVWIEYTREDAARERRGLERLGF